MRVMRPEDFVLRVHHALVAVGPEFLIHRLGRGVLVAAIILIELLNQRVGRGPLVVKVTAVGLLPQHLRPVGNILGVLRAADN